MATQPVIEIPVRVEEYLATVYEHDCEYVDGIVEERAVGEFDHACLQALLIGLFLQHRDDWGVFPLPEQRTQTRATRFRVPDVVVLRKGAPREKILKTPPLLAIEILSPEDSLRRTNVKAMEYLEFGIEHVWIIDPASRTGYRATPEGLDELENGVFTVPGTPIQVDLTKLFAELDEA
jgi:Uma2 family endonuclease